jgi:2-dehydro-3-deoxyphosphogluconate aldolase/(4S)-4-hydroxy-2-oxoglutarate aldolase
MPADVMQRVEQVGVVPIIRASSPDIALRIAEALVKAGIPVLEVTLTVPRGVDVIRRVREVFPDAFVGAGTVLDGVAAQDAVSGGAQFLVSPAIVPEVMAYGREHGVPTIPGALTPTEMLTAVTLGAEVVKLFPASLAGPRYLRTLQEPFPFLRLLPTGGINIVNLREWMAPNVVAVGVGTALIGDVAKTGDFTGLRMRAEELMRAVGHAREQAR